jgi:hypothetical protein
VGITLISIGTNAREALGEIKERIVLLLRAKLLRRVVPIVEWQSRKRAKDGEQLPSFC